MKPGPADPAGPVQAAVLAAEILAVAGPLVGGLWLRATAGPRRERLVAALAEALPVSRISPATDDEALFGGVDLAATLALRRPVHRAGLIEKGGIVVLTMAERCPPGLAARLGAAIDAGRIAVLALDEGAATDEVPPGALTDRLGLFATLDGIGPASAAPRLSAGTLARARARLAGLPLPEAAQVALARAAASLGVASMRALIAAGQAARAHAALEGRDMPSGDDLGVAAALTLAHHALPAAAEAGPPPPPSAAEPGEGREDGDPGDGAAGDVLVAAARAALPAGLLA
ncbi:MAG: magnesium chelatase ATPase subunit D, partial [Rhodobacteraceae bacterium]|nr:magnesium chelatase ATPase subunit D [Paracoccaceae bacterium]